MTRYLLVLLFFTYLYYQPGHAEKSNAPFFKAQTGTCSYPAQEEGEFSAALVNLCLNVESRADLLYLSKGEAKQRLAHETVVYSGLHLSRRHALLLSGRYFSSRDFAQDKNIATSLSSPYALYQYGKLYHDPVQVSIGRQALPFGVERQPLLGFFSLYHPRSFWQGPDLGINLTVSNIRSLFFQLGVFSEKKNAHEGKGIKPEVQAYTARIFFDKPSWQGSKLIFSLYGHRDGNDRLGIALINANSEQRVVQFEFIRTFFQGKFWNSEITQLIRLWLQSARKNSGQFFFLYDDVSRQSRFATLGSRYFINEYLSTQVGFTYFKSETSEKQIQWGLVGGIGASL